MNDTEYFDVQEDPYFRCPMCDLSHYFENSTRCEDCDERFCPECFKDHLDSDEHKRNAV